MIVNTNSQEKQFKWRLRMTQAATESAAPTAADNIQLLVNGIEAKWGKSAADVVSTYLPTLYTMGINEILALSDLVNAGKVLDAQNAIQNSMTADQLAQQKALLGQLAQRMASDNYQSKQFWTTFVGSAIKVAIMSLLPVVAL
jgi:hypothetical protein